MFSLIIITIFLLAIPNGILKHVSWKHSSNVFVSGATTLTPRKRYSLTLLVEAKELSLLFINLYCI